MNGFLQRHRIMFHRLILAAVFLILPSAVFCAEDINFIGGKHYFQDGEFDQAITYLKKSLETNPGDIQSLRYLALSYERKNLYAESISVWQEYLKYSLQDKDACQKHVSILSQLVESKKETEETTPEIAFTLVSDNYPESTIACIGLKVLVENYSGTGKHQDLIRAYRSLRERFPKETVKPNLTYAYAESLQVLNQTQEAAKIYKELLSQNIMEISSQEIKERLANSYISLAKRYVVTDKSQAIKLYQLALNTEPDYETAEVARKEQSALIQRKDDLLQQADKCYYQGDRKEDKEAKELYRILLTEYPSDEQAGHFLYHLAETQFLTGEWKEAIANWDRLMEKYPKSNYYVRSALRAGQVYVTNGDRKNGIKEFQKVVQSPPELYLQSYLCPVALFYIASNYVCLVDKPNALRYYRQMIKEYSNNQHTPKAKEMVSLVERWTEEDIMKMKEELKKEEAMKKMKKQDTIGAKR